MSSSWPFTAAKPPGMVSGLASLPKLWPARVEVVQPPITEGEQADALCGFAQRAGAIQGLVAFQPGSGFIADIQSHQPMAMYIRDHRHDHH